MATRYKYADVRYNNGNGALLCNTCSVIIAYGFDHEDKEHYCGKCIVNHRPVEFVIEHDEEYDLYTLYSIVETSFGGPAKNYVADGSLDYVQRIQSKLALDELARIGQEKNLE